jgi:hypothetical protein
MPTQITEVVQHLRRAIDRQDEAGLTDGQLLGSFIEQRDETAVAALVRRHGPLVYGVQYDVGKGNLRILWKKVARRAATRYHSSVSERTVFRKGAKKWQPTALAYGNLTLKGNPTRIGSPPK